MHNSTSVQNLQLHGPTWVSRMLAHASQSLTTSNKDMTLLHGTQSNTDSACGCGLLKFKVQLHARTPRFCRLLAAPAAKFQEQHSQMSAAVTSSQLRMLAQYQGGTCSLVGWFGSQTMQTLPNEPSLFSFLVCYCPWLFLLPQRGCNGELKVFFCMFFTEQGT